MQDGRTSRRLQAIAIARFFCTVFEDLTDGFIHPVLVSSPAKGFWVVRRRKLKRPPDNGHPHPLDED
jgi:hypothetical protein